MREEVEVVGFLTEKIISPVIYKTKSDKILRCHMYNISNFL